MPENITSTTYESKESNQADFDMKEPIKPLDTERQEEPFTDLVENTKTNTT